MVKLYTTTYCSYCRAAKQFMDEHDISYEEIDLSADTDLRLKISESAGGYRMVPMIFVGEKFIGGYQELVGLFQSGELAKILPQK